MSDTRNDDRDLLDRLNALRNQNSHLDPTKLHLSASRPFVQEEDLSTRLRTLRNGHPSPSQLTDPPQAPKVTRTAAKEAGFGESSDVLLPIADTDLCADPLRNTRMLETDDKTLDELLAQLMLADQWTMNPDLNEVQKLLDEACGVLPSNEIKLDGKGLKEEAINLGEACEQNPLIRDIDMSVFTRTINDDEGEEAEDESSLELSKHRLATESHEAQDIIARVLDEIEFEDTGSPLSHVPGCTQKSDINGQEWVSLFPSAPTTLLEPAVGRKSSNLESDISSRMAALRTPSALNTTDTLGLPPAPTFTPETKPKATTQKMFRDEEIDSWCIICQDDATLKCIGCDGDLYCAKCWKEGHVGSDVGWEEKRHHCVKYPSPT